jgi:phosphate transport system permease protein
MSEPLDKPPVDLTKHLGNWRSFSSYMLSVIAGLMTIMALVPLFSVLGMVIYRGSQRIGLELFTQLPPAAGMTGGGIGSALLGTLIVVVIAALISVPVGISAAVFLAEFGATSRLAGIARFAARVLAGLPSILAGVFAYVIVVKTMGVFSPLAGGVALAILMLPTVLLTAEEALRMVPKGMREAAIGMGATPTQVVWKIVLPTAAPGILTGVLLAVARAAGETAPLLFTMLFSDYWPRPALEPTASLAVLIYEFSGSPFPNQIEIAWAACLVLVVTLLAINLTARAIAPNKPRK